MSNNNTSPSTTSILILASAASFVTGVAVSLILGGKFVSSSSSSSGSSSASKSSISDGKHAGATIEGDDLSLFYGDIEELTTITKSRKFLPGDLYGSLVRDCVVCCVDCLLVRQRAGVKECLLVLRSSEPVKGVWWLPGGRLLKGETFFAAAKRKAQQETGLSNVTPIQVLGVWNTFFPTSHWDNDTSKGTQTVNPIVLVELNGDDDDTSGEEVKLDETSAEYRWISLDPDVAKANGEDKYVLQALLRLREWDPNYHRVC